DRTVRPLKSAATTASSRCSRSTSRSAIALSLTLAPPPNLVDRSTKPRRDRGFRRHELRNRSSPIITPPTPPRRQRRHQKEKRSMAYFAGLDVALRRGT